jgi:Ser/Thr protein kinase RdoA (MazF antagonist)
VSDKLSRLRRLAFLALGYYAVEPSGVTFIRHNENITFRVDDHTHAATYLLRIHDPISREYLGLRQHPDALRSELRWLNVLHVDTPLTVQQPIANRHDDYVTLLQLEAGIVPCTLLRWIDGEVFQQDRPDAPTLVWHLGAVMAQLHNHAAGWRPPSDFLRPRYDLDHFRTQFLRFLSTARANFLTAPDCSAIERTVEAVFAAVTPIAADPARLGLIHADLQGSNILVWGREIRPIDFSLCGFGYFLFDFGTTLPGIKRDLRPLFCDGYRRHRRFEHADARAVDAFFLLSRLGAYASMLPNPAEHAWLQKRIPRFVADECSAFLRGEPLL